VQRRCDMAAPRRTFGAAALLTALCWAGAPAAGAADSPARAATATAAAASAAPMRTLRYAFRVAETGFDPAKISDLYSRTVTGNLFEALYHYAYLASPARIKPLTAAALPEISADFRRFTIRLRPTIQPSRASAAS
jgi:ABC-type oligopeptide transport system substrate-binding subunit